MDKDINYAFAVMSSIT